MECQQCQLNFDTPPVREPRRFKCRKCGNIFVVQPAVKAPDKPAADDQIVTLETDPGQARIPGKPRLAAPPEDVCAMTYPARSGEALVPPPLDLPPSASPPPRATAPAAATAPAPSPAPPAGDPGAELPQIQVPGFELESLLGRGGMGVVFRARQLSLDRPVAIKILSPDLAKISKFVKRFDKEAKALSQLSHPGIVGVIDRGKVGDVCYLVMEYVPGTTLRYLLQHVQMTLREFLDTVFQILEALEYVHSKNIVHRDIKPDNVIITKNRRVKLADFGLACLLDPDESGGQNLTKQHTTMGTMNYMAPEQRMNAADVDARADLYSLGVILYEIVAGELPLGSFDAPSKVNPKLSKRLDAIIMKALRAKPPERYQTAREMMVDLKGYMDSVHKKAPDERGAPPEEDEERPITAVRIPKKSQPRGDEARSTGSAYSADEERRMWDVWKDQAKAAKEGEGKGPPGVGRGATTRRSALAPRDKAKAPAFYESSIGRAEFSEAATSRSRGASLLKSYLMPGAFMTAFVVGVGALLLPTFPFLGRIPLLGWAMMQVFHAFLSPYR